MYIVLHGSEAQYELDPATSGYTLSRMLPEVTNSEAERDQLVRFTAELCGDGDPK